MSLESLLVYCEENGYDEFVTILRGYVEKRQVERMFKGTAT